MEAFAFSTSGQFPVRQTISDPTDGFVYVFSQYAAAAYCAQYSKRETSSEDTATNTKPKLSNTRS
jgi:hypothetical protein